MKVDTTYFVQPMPGQARFASNKLQDEVDAVSVLFVGVPCILVL